MRFVELVVTLVVGLLIGYVIARFGRRPKTSLSRVKRLNDRDIAFAHESTLSRLRGSPGPSDERFVPSGFNRRLNEVSH